MTAEELVMELTAALERVTNECRGYLEDKPAPEVEMFNPKYVRPEEQAATALTHAFEYLEYS